jgi:alkylated DNA repair dioxygenase AlkB
MIQNLENNDMIFFKKNNDTYKKKNKEFIEKMGLLTNLNAGLTVMANAFGINGLYYIPNYLKNSEINILLDKINNETNLLPISSSENSRRVAHYGYFYSYDRSGLKPADAIPNYLTKLTCSSRINSLVKNLITNEFDQVIINEYQPNQQIFYHTDHVKLFGPIIACITVGESVPIKFKLGDCVKKINVEEGSMYIMTGDARYKWKHSLRNNTNNIRYSITYRTINKYK